MKKFRYLIYLIIMFFAFGYTANAQATLNVSTGSVTPGQSFTASVSMYNAAAWSIHVNASGPVSGCSINVADASADAMNTSNTFTTTCTATGTGTITITLSGDTTDQNGNTSYLSGTKTVTVATQTTVTPSNPTTPSNPSTPSTPSNPKTADTRSSNNNLKSLTVDGYELVKVNDTTYTLSVKNSVDHITIKAERADSKAGITGLGNASLKVGENKFTITVTAENGAKKEYTLTVTRRDSFFSLNDLKIAITDSESDEVMIVLTGGEVLKQSDMEQMKKSKKIFNFIKYDEDKKVLYSWIIDGKEITNTNQLDLTVSFEPEDIDKLQKEMNYAEGIYFETMDGNYPNNTKLKIYVGDLYKNGIGVRKHLFKNGSRYYVSDETKVKDGYLTVTLSNATECFLSRAEYVGDNIKKSNIFIPLCIVEAFIIVLLLVKLFKKKDAGKKNQEPEIIKTTPEFVSSPELIDVAPITTPTTAPDFPTNQQ